MQTWVRVVALLAYALLALTGPTYYPRAFEGVSASDWAALTPESGKVAVSSRSVSTRPFPLGKRVIISQIINQPFVRSQSSYGNYLWMLRLELVHALEPIQMAASTLIPFYDHMMEQVVEQLNPGTLRRSTRWQLGDVILEMYARDSQSMILPAMVYEMLGVLRGFAQRNLVGTFEGEVVSVIPGVSIWIRLKNAGVAQPSWGREN